MRPSSACPAWARRKRPSSTSHRYLTDYAAVLWVRSDTETSLVSGYRALAEVLGLPEKDESDSNKVAAAVRRWLGREPGYLLILDNADDPSLVKPYLPPDPRGHVLLTSRTHNFDVLGIRKPIGLPVLTPDEVLAFLLKHTDRDGPLDPAEQDAARTLAGELGYLPLELEQAAAYTVDHEEAFSTSTYLAVYRALQCRRKCSSPTGAKIRQALPDGSTTVFAFTSGRIPFFSTSVPFRWAWISRNTSSRC